MELIKYLDENFLTRDQLLEATKVKDEDFTEYQTNQLMPKPSYRLDLALSSDSFFGVHEENHEIEYYSKGYVSWLTMVHITKDRQLIYREFSKRYEDRVKGLKALGFNSLHPKVNGELPSHIAEEWDYFIQGIYGLCTKTGLPEDIAAKELAIIQINELSDQIETQKAEEQQLIRAVNLLDDASSEFAPHERLKSSRHRLINEVRRKFKLTR